MVTYSHHIRFFILSSVLANEEQACYWSKDLYHHLRGRVSAWGMAGMAKIAGIVRRCGSALSARFCIFVEGKRKEKLGEREREKGKGGRGVEMFLCGDQ